MRRTLLALSVVGGIGLLAACSGEPSPGGGDPCAKETFDQTMCQAAVEHHGYYYYGAWRPMVYAYPYSYYYGGYHTFVSNGGTVRSPGATVYSPSYSGSSSPSGGTGTVRGIGGSIGAAHASASAAT